MCKVEIELLVGVQKEQKIDVALHVESTPTHPQAERRHDTTGVADPGGGLDRRRGPARAVSRYAPFPNPPNPA